MDKNTFFGWLQEKALIIEANHLASAGAGALVLHGVITPDSKTKTAQWMAGALIWLGSYLIGKLNHKAAQDAPPSTEVPIAQSPKVAAARTSILIFACLSMSLCGCAYVRSTTARTPFVNTNGIVAMRETTTLTSYSLFDATATIGKVSNRSAMATNGVFAPGTYISGLDQNSNSSNAVAILQLIGALASKIVVP